ncbi:MAG TPA: hypothetical protein VKU60_11855, partial [Chloroflexota bacterium]|nr:hypothetical protein [Chloroflexota bacterium]
LFEGERYDSSTICQRTAARARELGLRVELGPEWYDVDTLDDLRRLEADLEGQSANRLTTLRELLTSTRQNVLALGDRHATN